VLAEKKFIYRKNSQYHLDVANWQKIMHKKTLTLKIENSLQTNQTSEFGGVFEFNCVFVVAPL